MSQRQFSARAATMLAATAGALAPVMESLAQRRRRRRNRDEEDEDDDDDNPLSRRQLLRRRRRREREEDNDDDDDRLSLRARRRRQQEREDADDDDGDDDGPTVISRKQSIVGDLGINEIVRDRIDDALSGRGGGGGGGGDANIVVAQDGDVLTVLTSDIEFAGDSEGFEVETGGISYSSGSGGGLLDDDFLS